MCSSYSHQQITKEEEHDAPHTTGGRDVRSSRSCRTPSSTVSKSSRSVRVSRMPVQDGSELQLGDAGAAAVRPETMGVLVMAREHAFQPSAA